MGNISQPDRHAPAGPTAPGTAAGMHDTREHGSALLGRPQDQARRSSAGRAQAVRRQPRDHRAPAPQVPRQRSTHCPPRRGLTGKEGRRHRRPASRSWPNADRVRNCTFNIVEVRKPELDAALVAEIHRPSSWNAGCRSVVRVKRAVQNAMRMGALGIRVNVAGRLWRPVIARPNASRGLGAAAHAPRRYRLCPVRSFDPVWDHRGQGLIFKDPEA